MKRLRGERRRFAAGSPGTRICIPGSATGGLYTAAGVTDKYRHSEEALNVLRLLAENLQDIIM